MQETTLYRQPFQPEVGTPTASHLDCPQAALAVQQTQRSSPVPQGVKRRLQQCHLQKLTCLYESQNKLEVAVQQRAAVDEYRLADGVCYSSHLLLQRVAKQCPGRGRPGRSNKLPHQQDASVWLQAAHERHESPSDHVPMLLHQQRPTMRPSTSNGMGTLSKLRAATKKTIVGSRWQARLYPRPSKHM